MPLRLIDDSDMTYWSERPDVLRVSFNSQPLLLAEGISIDAEDADRRLVTLLDQRLADVLRDVDAESPGVDYGPHAGAGLESFIDLVTLGKDLAEAVVLVVVLARHLKAIGAAGVRVGERGIEMLARRDLQSRGHRGDSVLVSLKLIPMPTHLTGPPPGFLGYSVVFRADDDRLITLKYSLDGILEDYGETTGR